MLMSYLCSVNLKYEIYAPTRNNLRAHGGGGILLKIGLDTKYQHLSINNLKFKNYGIESKS